MTTQITVSILALGFAVTLNAAPCRWVPAGGDEFSYSGSPDPKVWAFENGDGGAFGNHEAQYYTDRLENAEVKNGRLIIRAKKESFKGNSYTSARLRSVKSFTYGRFEARVKLPPGRGLWPAIWLLAAKKNYGDQFWPDNGEIDFMENVGRMPNLVLGVTHTKNFSSLTENDRGGTIIVPDSTTHFHNYAVEWVANQIHISVDKKVFFALDKTDDDWRNWPFDKPFRLIINLAVGGDFGGAEGIDDGALPAQLEIEHIRFGTPADPNCQL